MKNVTFQREISYLTRSIISYAIPLKYAFARSHRARFREADSVLTEIENGIESADENVSQNPQRSDFRWHVHAHETG